MSSRGGGRGKATPGCEWSAPVPSPQFLHAGQPDTLTSIDDRWDYFIPALPYCRAAGTRCSVVSLLRLVRAQHTQLRQYKISPRRKSSNHDCPSCAAETFSPSRTTAISPPPFPLKVNRLAHHHFTVGPRFRCYSSLSTTRPTLASATMPRRSSSPARKRSAPSSSDSEGKPDIKPKAEPNAKANPGRLDTQSRAALAAIVIQRGIASTLAEVDTVTIEVSWTSP